MTRAAPRAPTPRGNNLAKIHIAKAQLCLDDETYQALLERLFGVTSAKDLNYSQHLLLLAEFRRLGWKPKPAKNKMPSLREPQLRKILLLWHRLLEAGIVTSPERSALLHFVERMTGLKRLEWLSVHQARNVIEALKAWGQRKGADIR